MVYTICTMNMYFIEFALKLTLTHVHYMKCGFMKTTQFDFVNQGRQ